MSIRRKIAEYPVMFIACLGICCMFKVGVWIGELRELSLRKQLLVGAILLIPMTSTWLLWSWPGLGICIAGIACILLGVLLMVVSIGVIGMMIDMPSPRKEPAT